MSDTVLVGLGSSVAEVARAFQCNSSIRIDPKLSENGLLQLIDCHRDESYGPALAQMIVLHVAAGENSCARILALYTQDTGAANAVATSGRASRSQLQELLGHKSPSVRHHAGLALFRGDLDEASKHEIERLFAATLGDSDFSKARRFILAGYAGTPPHILHALRGDNEDYISAAAEQTIKAIQGQERC